MILAGILLGGYAGYFLVRTIIAAPGIGNFFKVVILVGVSGLITTIVGLIRERRKESHNVSDND